MNGANKMSHFSNQAHSSVTRPIKRQTTSKNRYSNQKVNTVWEKKVNTAKPTVTINAAKAKARLNVVKAKRVNVVKASACWGNPQVNLQDKGVIDSGCSRHMIGNMSYLIDYKEIYGGYVAFGSNPREGRSLAKATSDEFKLWHRRLGHLNFKTMNKLVKINLVRSLPSKIFKYDESCVACQKGKQHRASYKTKAVNTISQPLQMLHMDLFGPTFVKSLMKKMYCLVVTDDYSRFTWVFILATKDETSGILKAFIIRIENLVDHKVKVIRCDNGTEFKNREMTQFCEMKGIMRQYSVARTPQQNGVAERRNRTLIEAARTMLADSKLPTTFWAKAVNTACYVQNRVLVIKPHNKTPYELFHGRTPTLSFMRPFGCPVTILNTIDHIGKFDEKDDEGFFVGYSLNSKAFRVFNSRTRIVEENLHINFSENTPNIIGSGPSWFFDIDALTKTMNYEPVVAQSNNFADAGCTPSCDAEKKDDKVPRNESDIDDQERSNEATYDDFFGAEANMRSLDEIEMDMSNITTTYPIPTTPNTRIHIEHSLGNVIGDVQSGVQTRRMTKTTDEQGNKKDERGIVISNKARLVAQGHTQEEGIDYDEVFAPVARIEAIRLFLAYASFMGFLVYQMDLKSSFLYGSIEEERKDRSDLVYQEANRRYYACIDVKPASTPIDKAKALRKDSDGDDVDVHLYRSMIGSLMYLTSSRPDIMFAVCSCARFQVTPKVSHLHAVKRIFRYLKGQPNLGLWYPRDSPFDLVAYTDSDYAEASLDRKSTTRGCQFLGCRLISWQCNKQTMVATSTTKAKYVAATSCYGQVL
ncbi:putative ribonuclease H-like domain-containing protein [Tanacetum coccineum]|uniref:Ribonuclease H-like domain-containing protein n=1 Tax=Tanacetum coccineum TaxID=301880 RepID=A0ABQ5BX68_9ASTR